MAGGIVIAHVLAFLQHKPSLPQVLHLLMKFMIHGSFNDPDQDDTVMLGACYMNRLFDGDTDPVYLTVLGKLSADASTNDHGWAWL